VGADTGAASSGGSTLTIVGLVVGGVGVIGLGAGAVFGLQAKSKNDEALQPQNCRTPTLCTPNGLSLTTDAKNAATISTVSFVAGGALVAGGLAMFLLAPSSSGSSTPPAHGGMRVTPWLGPVGGLSLDGAF
jgi:serine/threonine-protein kinase